MSYQFQGYSSLAAIKRQTAKSTYESGDENYRKAPLELFPKKDFDSLLAFG
jgi:hypothetical protein